MTRDNIYKRLALRLRLGLLNYDEDIEMVYELVRLAEDSLLGEVISKDYSVPESMFSVDIEELLKQEEIAVPSLQEAVLTQAKECAHEIANKRISPYKGVRQLSQLDGLLRDTEYKYTFIDAIGLASAMEDVPEGSEAHQEYDEKAVDLAVDILTWSHLPKQKS